MKKQMSEWPDCKDHNSESSMWFLHARLAVSHSTFFGLKHTLIISGRHSEIK